MTSYRHTIGQNNYIFKDIKDLLARATPIRSGDYLAGLGAVNAQERVAAQMALAALPLKSFLNDLVIPYECDEISRLIIDSHDAQAFKTVSHLTVGDFRNWLLSDEADATALQALSKGLTPEMVAAISKIMRIQDLVIVSKKCEVVSKPNHPTV